MVEGFKSFLNNNKKFTVDYDWEKARDKWLNWGNSIQRFIQQCVERKEGKKISSSDLHDKYSEYAGELELDIEDQRKLTKAVKNIAYASYSENYTIDGKRQRGFKGITVNLTNINEKGKKVNSSNNKHKTQHDQHGLNLLHPEYEKELNSDNDDININRHNVVLSVLSNNKFKKLDNLVNSILKILEKVEKVKYEELEEGLNLPDHINSSDLWHELRKNDRTTIENNEVVRLNDSTDTSQKEKVKTILHKLEDLQEDGEPVHHNALVDKIDLPTKEFNALLDKIKKMEILLNLKTFTIK